MKIFKNLVPALAFVFALGAALVTSANSKDVATTVWAKISATQCDATFCTTTDANSCSVSGALSFHTNNICTSAPVTPKRP